MAGTKAGGLKARDRNLARNPNHYKEIGRKGGQASNTGGFAANLELARTAGAKGGRISRRGPAKKTERYSPEKAAASLSNLARKAKYGQA